MEPIVEVEVLETNASSRASSPPLDRTGLRASHPPPEPMVLEPALPDRRRTHFRDLPASSRSEGLPRAIAWFGFRSFWGHLRRFAASAIATEDVDTRDWMEPTEPAEFARRAAEVLGAPGHCPTLAQCLGRDVWIDFVSDTGDDAELSERLAKMFFREYLAPDPTDPERQILLPRGDILLHGGDVAYPVATADEIHDRLVVPWNRGIREVGDDTQTRVLLGIPGNHDWYDGIDGFARMFRERHYGEDPEAQTVPLDTKFLGRAMQYVGQFLAGETLKKSKALVLSGYKPIQRSSYFVLPITPTVHLHAVDRQLRRIDYRQRRFFQEWCKQHKEAARILVMHYPVFPFGRPSRRGLSALHALRLSPEYEPHFCLAGDIHHYRRETIGRSIHVTAGGGGAFVHPVPMDDMARAPADKHWPGPEQCRSLLPRVPLRIALGRSGWIAHGVMLLVFAPLLGIGGTFLGRAGLVPGSIAAGLLSAVVMAFIGGVREEYGKRVALIAGVAGTLMGLVPSLTLMALEPLADAFNIGSSTWPWGLLALSVAVLFGGLVFGTYLTVVTALGYELTQAFTALAHHGYKHFVRFRVRADGSGADVFVIGIEDAFDPEEKPRLVDAFFWESPVREGDHARRSSIHPDPGGLRPSVDRRNLSGKGGERSSRPSSIPPPRSSLAPAAPHEPAEKPTSIPPPARGGSDPPSGIG